ncbi:type II toxin-antitoxin system HigB family toxin [Ancylothrix sp. C2]|uniref:type II toxin-antitoxin system HigB family toxin n=1 Tax=Ancylothrix sp. D3o TaxID=2953691 RepID=UPI0021BAC0F7|nr:type II toxin-antitoxin system HigB family toxin [Ancylothrix sp. D3o]MCT7951311.1 type II toxin-antitoxin system HigB family toxin [Ancylothrix sp. D3o]
MTNSSQTEIILRYLSSVQQLPHSFIDIDEISLCKLKLKEMHLISIRNLRAAANQYPDVKKQIDDWYANVKQAEWQNLEDVRQIYRDAEAVGNFTGFNIKGNDYRLIVGINYEKQTVYYKYFLTHAEYDKNKWKNDDYF